MKPLRITLGGCSSKKTSPIIVRGRSVVLPSKQYQKWSEHQLSYEREIRGKLEGKIPVTVPVNIAAVIFRAHESSGDTLGYLEALADIIQENHWRCLRPESQGKCGKRTVGYRPLACQHCGWKILKQSRHGLGILLDDNLARTWNGSDMDIDRENPRCELRITDYIPRGTIVEPQARSLFEDEPR